MGNCPAHPKLAQPTPFVLTTDPADHTTQLATLTNIIVTALVPIYSILGPQLL